MRVAVIGLGAIGAQVLWQLSRVDGVEVHGFDKSTAIRAARPIMAFTVPASTHR